MNTSMLDLFRAARQVSIPIVSVRTADPIATIEDIRAAHNDFPLAQWDAARGITPINKLGEQALEKAGVQAADTVGFVEAMIAAHVLPQKAVLFVHHGHRQLQSSEPLGVAAAVQAVSNLREPYKRSFRMLAFVGPHLPLPAELEHDIVVIDHPLPGDEPLRQMVGELHVSASLTAPKPEVMTKAVDAIGGLSLFAAEQVTAMSLTPSGLDLEALWERKRTAIEQTPGLNVWRGKERFSDLVGLDSIKTHLANQLLARTPIGVVVFFDEIDKVLANVEHDTSGVRMDQLRTLLTEMENNEWRGLVAVGVAGGGKSALAKAFGNEAGVPTIAIDLGGMESQYVGESEQRLRGAMAIIKAVGRGHAYFIATSNNASVMRPELQRRFSDGIWMFDLMGSAERKAAWKLYTQRYELPTLALPEDDGWTGAEIRNCCRYAWNCRCALADAARFIVPMARSRADEIERLRKFANGRCLDANHPGVYQYTSEPMAQQMRAIALPGQMEVS